MPRPRNIRRSRGSRARRPTAWFNGTILPVTIGAGAASTTDWTPKASIPEGYAGGFTVLRAIINLQFDAVTANQQISGNFGLCVVTRDAFAGGALPDPITDLVDWYLLRPFRLINPDRRVMELNFDLHTSRRIRGEDRTLVSVTESDSGSASNLGFSFGFRLLLQQS